MKNCVFENRKWFSFTREIACTCFWNNCQYLIANILVRGVRIRIFLVRVCTPSLWLDFPWFLFSFTLVIELQMKKLRYLDSNSSDLFKFDYITTFNSLVKELTLMLKDFSWNHLHNDEFFVWCDVCNFTNLLLIFGKNRETNLHLDNLVGKLISRNFVKSS